MLPASHLLSDINGSILPRIVAVGYRRINNMLQDLVASFANQAHIDVLDVGFKQAVSRIRDLHAQSGVDVVVAAGSNGAYLRQHLDRPVVLVKVGGFDVMRAMAQAHALLDAHMPARIGLVTYAGMAPDLSAYQPLWQVEVVQRSYQSEEEAQLCVHTLHQAGVSVVVGTGTVADQADALGMRGVFLYSMDAVREALHDAIEVARTSRIEQAKRERLNTILTQLSDGVIAVDAQENIQIINPTMAAWLGISATQWQGQGLSDVCPELSLRSTLALALPDDERIEHVQGKPLIVNRMPIVEQGQLTGAVLTCQDPIRIQRVDRQIRTRIKSRGHAARYALDDYLGSSPQAAQVRDKARQCATSQATVLLVGESGTGKELVAQGIHLASERRDMPFVAVNCAAIAESLLESELFGYEEGAFTGARRGGKIGLFEAAHNGTIFLDEVAEMPLSLQAHLLRVLQAREVMRVGATEPTPINVRVIAATHQHLSSQVQQGLFRLDLYYRLNILHIDVPALRQRITDLPLLADQLHQRICARLGTQARASAKALKTLVDHAPHYHWPGNVRELENLIERLVVMPVTSGKPAGSALDALNALMPELFAGVSRAPVLAAVPQPAEPSNAGTAEQRHLLAVLDQCQGDRAQAARVLGMSRTTLWRKLKPK